MMRFHISTLNETQFVESNFNTIKCFSAGMAALHFDNSAHGVHEQTCHLMTYDACFHFKSTIEVRVPEMF